MVDLNLRAPWSRLPLIHDDTDRFPDPTMLAIAESPELQVHIDRSVGLVAGELVDDAAASAVAAGIAQQESTDAAADAATSAASAGTAAFNAGSSAAAAQSSEDDARAASGEAAGAMAGAVAARGEAVTAKAAAEAARDLALAGQFLGAAVNTVVDINTYRTPGRYRIQAAATASAGLPVATAGVLDVFSVTGVNNATQEFTPFAGSATSRKGFYRRTAANSGATWDAWQFFSGLRVDQVAGRAIYAWDDINAREQMIYGDTGWRDISSLLENGWLGNVSVRRTGLAVWMRFEGIDPSKQTSQLPIRLPVGFRGGSIGNERFELHNALNPAGMFRGYAQNNGLVYVIASGAAGLLYGSVQMTTADSWPTALPGTAVGSIPA